VVTIVEGIIIGTLAAQLFLFVYYGYAAIPWMVVLLQAPIVTVAIVASRLLSRRFPPA
jgi:uncharacterized protein (DUF983 family)